MVPTWYFVLLLFSVTSFLRSVESSRQGSSSCHCGIANVRTTRIIEGKETVKNEFPWIAAVVQKQKPEPWCSATIINSLYVLTLSECVPLNVKNVELAIGKHRTAGNDELMRVNVARNITHPNPNITIVLLRLSTPIKFPKDNSIAPACLPSKGRANYNGKRATVAGWGFMQLKTMQRSEVLMKLFVTVASQAYCKSKIPLYNRSTNMCTKPMDGKGIDAFHDRGSPLLLPGKNNVYSVIGVSYRPGGGEINVPDSYYRLVRILPWIKKQTADGEFCSRPL